MVSLYIHIPFCIKKCGYCDFLSFKYDQDSIHRYISSLLKEIKLHSPKKVYTVFIGGGTPSLLSPNDIKRLFKGLHDQFDMSDCVEITIEANPGTLTEEKILAYQSVGINRVSMGVQTLVDESLQTLGRIHDVSTVYATVDLLKKHNFTNYNMDLMFGLPYQTMDMLDKSLDKMIGLEPMHISAYSLKIEENTAFDNLYEEVDEELDRQMYHLIVDKLEANGYMQYEISNFSKVNYPCKHNLVYWQEKDYIGLGLGASGFEKSIRYTNVSNLDDYHTMIDALEKPIDHQETIDRKELMFEMIILRLRLNQGLNIQSFDQRFHCNFKELYGSVLEELLEEGLVEMNHTLKLTALGRDMSNQVYIKFL